MNSNNSDHIEINTERKAKIIATIMGTVALVSPFVFNYYYDVSDGIFVIDMYSLIWVHDSNANPAIFFYLPLLVNNPVNTLLRFWFVFTMYRCYVGKSSRRKAIYAGLISETWQLIMMVSNILMSLGFSYLPGLFYVPIPLLLLAGLLILLFVKPPEPPGLWTDKSDKSVDSKTPTSFLSD